MTETQSARVEVRNRLGLHARAAAKLVHLANRYRSQIRVSKDGQIADAKSIMGVLLLCGHRGCELTLEARGEDAEDALRALSALVADGFGEKE